MEKEKLDKVINKINNMRSVRESYPGWLILPIDNWNGFTDTDKEIPLLKSVFDEIDDVEIKLSFVYELNWRCRISLTPITGWIIDAIKNLTLNQELRTKHKKEIIDLEYSLLLCYRHYSKFDLFDNLYNELLGEALYIPKRKICYEGCLRYLGELNINKIADICLQWDINYGDYQNCLQKAEMLFLLGRINELEEVLDNSIQTAERFLLNDKDDIFTRNCLAFLLRAYYRYFKRSYSSESEDIISDSEFDSIYKYSEHLITSISNAIQRPQDGFSTNHGFQIGDYTNNWNFSNGLKDDFLISSRWILIKEALGVSAFSFSPVLEQYTISSQLKYNSKFALYILTSILNSNLSDKTLIRKNLVHIDEKTANEYFDVIFKVLKGRENIQQTNLRSNIQSSIPIVLSRLSTVTSQDRNVALAKEFLNLIPSLQLKNFKVIIDNLDNKNIGLLIPSMIDYALANPNNNYGLPERYTNVPNDKHTLIKIEEQLNSNDSVNRRMAFTCISYLFKYINIDAKTRMSLAKLVKEFRKNHQDSHISLLSYDLVNCDELEKVQLLTFLNNNVNKFCSTSYIFKNSSEELSKWYKDFQDVCILWRRLSIEQINKVLSHNIELINKNESVFKRDDSTDVLGGIRSFCANVIHLLIGLCLSIDIKKLDKVIAQSLIQITEKLISWGYKCLPLKIKLHLNWGDISETDYNYIYRLLFSSSREDQREATETFFVIYDSKGDVSPILDKVFTALEVASPVTYKNILILLANLLSRKYDNTQFLDSLKAFLTNIKSSYETYGFDIVGRCDLMHYVNFVAGAYSVRFGNMEPIFDKKTGKFNDVVIGYDKGKELVEEFDHEKVINLAMNSNVG